MTEQSQRGGADRLPIKLLLPRQGKERRVAGGGSPPKPFRQVDRNYRNSLARQVSAIQRAMLPDMAVTGAVPVRVKLHPRAFAKSHRPEALFSQNTCPIVGAGRLGELFVKATNQGLTRLNQVIHSGETDQLTKELSCIETIEVITPSFRRKGRDTKEVLRQSPRGHDGFVTRVRLFNFGADEHQPRLVAHFEEVCRTNKIRFSPAGYSLSSFVYAAECRSTRDVDTLANIVGVRSISGMPIIRTLRPHFLNAKSLPKVSTRAEVDGDVPVVVVVDSGIDDRIPALASWIVGRESLVAPKYRNTDHGTFVAGLICWGEVLNPTFSGIDANPCALYDLQVLPNQDPNKGETETILEQELLIALDKALQEHANEFKVWNLSLGTNEVCSLDEFSEFAEEIDNLQEKYQISFVISAGNFDMPPLLDYPRNKAHLESGRITTPADSVLGVAVGSISHVDYKSKGPKLNQPSAFSRHGAGPNYVIKPDLVHFGGSCSLDATHLSGIRSVHALGTAEDCGTSFSTPLVARTLAQIYHQITPAPSPVLARALLTHHARDPRTQSRVPDGEENYFGFGLPAPVPYCLECTPFTSTLVFQDVLRPGFYQEWDDFPYPASLIRGGRYFGEIWMTVAFAPARGARWGSEYCETHIDAHFGVYRKKLDPKTGKMVPKFTGLVPPEHKNPGELYESFQVAHLRKWAPVRTYHGSLGPKGREGDRWRLKVKLLTRHGIDDGEILKAQPFALILTIADPQRRAPVYDEMARIVMSRYQAQNLAVRAAARVRGRV